MQIFLYLIPFIPLLDRLILILWYKDLMKEILSEDELDRDAHRNYILALTGFSFTGLLALALLEATVISGFYLTIYYLLISFLLYLFSLNFQGYKAKRWQDQLSTSFSEVATLALICSIISILFIKEFEKSFAFLLASIAMFIWFFDHLYRIRLQTKYLSLKRAETK